MKFIYCARSRFITVVGNAMRSLMNLVVPIICEAQDYRTFDLQDCTICFSQLSYKADLNMSCICVAKRNIHNVYSEGKQ